MIDAVVAWALAQPKLDWIDLQVFASNEPARALYKRTGFVEVGLCRDAFRMDDGTRIDDIHMVLDLGALRSRRKDAEPP